MARSSVLVRTLGRWLLLAGAAVASLSAQAVEWKPGHTYWASRSGNIYEVKGPGISPVGGGSIVGSAPTVTGSSSGVLVKSSMTLPLASGKSAAVEVMKQLPWSSMASAMRAVARVAGPAAIGLEAAAWLADTQISAQPCGPVSTSCDGAVQWQERDTVMVSPGARLKFGGPSGYDSADEACLALNALPGGFAGAVLNESSSGGGWVVYDCMWRYAPPNPTEPFKSGSANGRYYCGTSVASIVNGAIVCPNEEPEIRWKDVPWTYVEPKLAPGPSDAAGKAPRLWPELLPGGIPDTSSPPTVSGPTWVSGPTTTSTDPNGNPRTRTTGWDLEYGPGRVTVRERTVDGDGSTEEKPYESPSEDMEHFCQLYPDSALCKPAPSFEDKNDVQEFCNNNPNASMCKPFPSQDPASAPTPADPASSPTDCDKNPDALGCIDAGEPPQDEEIPKSEESVTLEQEAFAVGGGCPPPQTFSAGRFGSFEMRYDLACQGFTWLAPVVKALGAFAAAMICLAALRQGA